MTWRARSLTGATAASAAAASSGGDDPGPAREAFLGWYAARHDDVPQDAADAVDTILHEWGPRAHPGERSRYACSPHRIKMAAHLIRDGYFPDYTSHDPSFSTFGAQPGTSSDDDRTRARPPAIARPSVRKPGRPW